MAQKDMTQSEMIADLKQFIGVTVKNIVDEAIETKVRTVVNEVVHEVVNKAVSESEDRVKKEFNRKIDQLRDDMNDGFSSIADIIDNHQDQLDGHGKRITRLERRAA